MKKREAQAGLNLGQLRRSRGKTQVEIAEPLEMDQAQVSRFERRTDHLVSSVSRYVEALGGEASFEVVFPDGTRIRLRDV